MNTRIPLVFALLVVAFVATTPVLSQDKSKTDQPISPAETKQSTKTIPKVAASPGLWVLAYTLEMPGTDQAHLIPLRNDRLSAVTKGLMGAQPAPHATRMELLDPVNDPPGLNRWAFNKYVRNNPKIRVEDYRRYLAGIYEGGVLVQRVMFTKEGPGIPIDEEPLLLMAGYDDEWPRVRRLVMGPVRLDEAASATTKGESSKPTSPVQPKN